MIEIPGHITPKSSVNNFPLIDIPPIQAKHVASKMKVRLPDIS